MTLLSTKLRAALAKPFLPVVFFFAGVTYDTVTLTRIDRLFDNVMLLLYLTLLGALIVLKGRADLGQAQFAPAGTEQARHFLTRAEPYYPMAIQFLLGGLFSAYTIFYSQSASLTTTAVFFGVLVVLLVGNELLHDRLSNLKLLVSLYALVGFCFFTFFLPVLTGIMNWIMVVLGAVLSLALALRVLELVYQGQTGRSRMEAVKAGFPALAVVLVLIAFYFLNWIPPVPLSLKLGGIYHQVEKVDGAYHLTFEKPAWYQVMKRSDNPFHGEGPAYCFTAVFAPVDLKTTVYHRWQYRMGVPGKPAETGDFSTTDRIPIRISGGREGGYRSYTIKQHVPPGEWRVDVETEDGRVIGRVRFRVEAEAGRMLDLQTMNY
ncbi:MAG: DUF2914 domain-containing protein [Nitrospirota bacterium]|nr:DUF2914 domain-containing protein [Nitrospirota bacterium]